MANSAARKERRRKRMEEENKMEAAEVMENTEFQMENRLFRRDTYVLSKSKSDLNVVSMMNDSSDPLNLTSIKEDSSGTSIRTYNVHQKFDSDTYNVIKSEDTKLSSKPVPAPRRSKSILAIATERVSSDTDKDVADLDLNDLSARNKSDSESKSGKIREVTVEKMTSTSEESVVMPVPKPRKRVQISRNSQCSNVPSESGESSNKDGDKKIEKEKEESGEDEEQNASAKTSKELPLIENLEYTLKTEKEVDEALKKQKKLRIGDLIEKKGGKKAKKTKSGKMFSSLMKLEKGKIPKIALILKDLKESEKKNDNKGEEEDEETEEQEGIADFQIDSPRYPESVQNGQIYVQDKNGFYVMEREEVLKSGGTGDKNTETDRGMEDSTVRTAIYFQKYWSRTMMYFHGILAGFAFGHTAMVTAIVLHFNYDPKGFIDIYSQLSLKIHYIFYALTTFCIVSCFDRVDIGHINRKHWKTAWRAPSMWAVLGLYMISFGLTFSNQKTQARFDAYSYITGNDTDQTLWNTQDSGEIQTSFLTWFHTVWARDVLLLIAWLVISLTKFSDFLCGHLNNMIKYTEGNSSDK